MPELGKQKLEEPHRVKMQSNLLQVTYGKEDLPLVLSAARDNFMIQKQGVKSWLAYMQKSSCNGVQLSLYRQKKKKPKTTKPRERIKLAWIPLYFPKDRSIPTDNCFQATHTLRLICLSPWAPFPSVLKPQGFTSCITWQGTKLTPKCKMEKRPWYEVNKREITF